MKTLIAAILIVMGTGAFADDGAAAREEKIAALEKRVQGLESRMATMEVISTSRERGLEERLKRAEAALANADRMYPPEARQRDKETLARWDDKRVTARNDKLFVLTRIANGGAEAQGEFVTPLLVSLKKDQDGVVRERVAQTLAAICPAESDARSKDIVMALRYAARADSDKRVTKAAAEALETIKNRGAENGD